MNREELTRIGVLHKPWGNKGELIADLSVYTLEDFDPEGWFFVDVNKQLVPFRYESLRETNKQGLLIKFADYGSPEEATFLSGRNLYVTNQNLLTEKKSAIPEEELLGVVVIDTTHGNLGSVIRTEGSRSQTVLVILKGTKEVLIPLAEDLVDAYDPENRVLTVSTPPGLVDMYLS